MDTGIGNLIAEATTLFMKRDVGPTCWGQLKTEGNNDQLIGVGLTAETYRQGLATVWQLVPEPLRLPLSEPLLMSLRTNSGGQKVQRLQCAGRSCHNTKGAKPKKWTRRDGQPTSANVGTGYDHANAIVIPLPRHVGMTCVQ